MPWRRAVAGSGPVGRLAVQWREPGDGVEAVHVGKLAFGVRTIPIHTRTRGFSVPRLPKAMGV
jgi:hypothetical protein